jgi:hypothetical protein
VCKVDAALAVQVAARIKISASSLICSLGRYGEYGQPHVEMKNSQWL